MIDMVNKKRRCTLDHGANSSTTTARVSLTGLPIEILAEILLYTSSPPTVLAVSRTCSFLYRSLALNPNASFIWRGVRKTCSPVPLPEPGRGWKRSEADYAALVFGGGICEVCHKTTRAMYTSFSARIRLCGNWHCRAKFLDESLVNVTSQTQTWHRTSFWVPPVESTRCFYPFRLGALIWPRGELLLRKSDWEAFQRDVKAYENAEKAQAEREQAVALTGLPPPAGEEDGQRERIAERCRAARERLPQIMELAVCLVRWKWSYDQEFKTIKKHNSTWTKNLAEREGWNLEDLVESQTYGSLQRRKTFLLEKMEAKDVSPIRTVIESELLTLQARHKRQEAEASYRGKLTEVKKIYERMRCGTVHTGSSGSSDPLILPPLSVFCTLPSVRALKGSPDPNALPPSSTSDTSDINSALGISLIKADIHKWLVPVQKYLMALLGYPNGWQSASTRTLHPLKRVTARFFCRRCGEGRVGKAHQREQCLDFKGVCSHVCVAAPRKTIQDENGKEREGSKGKNSVGKMSDWKVDIFEKDEKAIRVVKTILIHLGMFEDTATVSSIKEETHIVCMSCKGWIVMDFETAIGHARRHESMEIRVLSGFLPTRDEVSKIRGEFARGNCELLLGPSYRARRLCKKVNYGCKHCLTQEDIWAGTEKPVRLMDFNGLRSHVKGKHGIQDIRDEDFFCYTSIKDEDD